MNTVGSPSRWLGWALGFAISLLALPPGLGQTNCSGGDPLQCLAVAESTEAGARAQGDYTATFVSDNIFEVLTEQDATVGPPPKRADLLQHTWTINVPAANSYTVFVEAFRTDAGGDGDNFSFAYSLNGGQSWTTMLVVDNGGADAVYSYGLGGGAGGSLLIRATDTDRTSRNKNHASLSVDRIHVEPSSDDPVPPDPDPTVSEKRIVGYYASWSIYDRNYFVSDIPAGKLTHINYAFANLEQDGRVVLGDEFADVNKIFGNEPPGAAYKGNFQQLNILKSQHPHLKTLISLGGWTWSNHFSDVFANDPFPNSQQTFCESLLNFVETYGFDGADIDWEYPGSAGEGDNSFRPGEDGQNYVDTLALCRPMFENAGKLLTAATPCDPALYEGQMNLGAMAPYLDWVNLLSYDLHGPWDPITGHHSQLYMNPGDPDATNPNRSRFNQNACAMGHKQQGVPLDKIHLGVPFFSHSYAKVTEVAGGSPAILGLFQPFNGVPKGTWDGGRWGITGVFDYQDIVENILPQAAPAFDSFAKVPTLTWSLGKKNGMGFMSYDDRESTCAKADYVLQQGLGGLTSWELSADIEDHPESLVQAEYCGLNPGYEGCGLVCE